MKGTLAFILMLVLISAVAAGIAPLSHALAGQPVCAEYRDEPEPGIKLNTDVQDTTNSKAVVAERDMRRDRLTCPPDRGGGVQSGVPERS
jgi:hypothetical protein